MHFIATFARLFIDAICALEESVTDFWHPVYAILYTTGSFRSATNARQSVLAEKPENCEITFASQHKNAAKHPAKGFD
ncbi:hypothetical protein [Thalassospira lucentensis]|uniref:hypothetical protein n=1 Tax=Thalassospira lucentensis TaxID=168935 RepID=UPI003AA8C6C8